MLNSSEEIIDLTYSDDDEEEYRNRRIIHIHNDAIDLRNEPLDGEKRDHSITDRYQSQKRKSVIVFNEKKKEINLSKDEYCVICWEKLGDNPLAATVCGHVFCYMCLNNSSQRIRSCPICKKPLIGLWPYRRLYFTYN